MRHTLGLINLNNVPIFEQLRLEEALLRADSGNWCLTNMGSPHAIVMGISGKPEHLLNFSHVEKHGMPIIRRFSGGGTVAIDPNTLFVTMICNSEDVKVPCFPENIHRWVEAIYRKIFLGSPFSLRENDYVMGDRKCGGNAQYLCKNRWLHHTSFLWDYNPEIMQCLLLPAKRPKYRESRSHDEFLCRLKDFVPSANHVRDKIGETLGEHFQIQPVSYSAALPILENPHRRATERLMLDLTGLTR